MHRTFRIKVAWASDNQTFVALFVRIELCLQVEITSLILIRGSDFKNDFNLVVIFVHFDIIVVMRVVLPQLFLPVWALLQSTVIVNVGTTIAVEKCCFIFIVFFICFMMTYACHATLILSKSTLNWSTCKQSWLRNQPVGLKAPILVWIFLVVGLLKRTVRGLEREIDRHLLSQFRNHHPV